MTPSQIVTVALRLLAIWVGFGALRILPSFFLLGAPDTSGRPYAVFLLAATAVIVLGLWFFPATIAGKILPAPSAEPPNATAPDTWFAMGCSLIGVWILTTTFPALVLNTYFLNRLTVVDSPPSELRSALYEAAEAAIALWLILGGKGVKRLYRWLENAAVDKAL
jgi:hypothetical protein